MASQSEFLRLSLKGATELARKFRRLGKKVGVDARKAAVKSGGKIMLREMRRDAPVGKTRQLRSKMFMKVRNRRGESTAEVGTTAKDRKGKPYPFFVEYRKGNARSKGFMQRSFDSSSPRAGAKVISTFKRSVDRAVR